MLSPSQPQSIFSAKGSALETFYLLIVNKSYAKASVYFDKNKDQIDRDIQCIALLSSNSKESLTHTERLFSLAQVCFLLVVIGTGNGEQLRNYCLTYIFNKLDINKFNELKLQLLSYFNKKFISDYCTTMLKQKTLTDMRFYKMKDTLLNFVGQRLNSDKDKSTLFFPSLQIFYNKIRNDSIKQALDFFNSNIENIKSDLKQMNLVSCFSGQTLLETDPDVLSFVDQLCLAILLSKNEDDPENRLKLFYLTHIFNALDPHQKRILKVNLVIYFNTENFISDYFYLKLFKTLITAERISEIKEFLLNLPIEYSPTGENILIPSRNLFEHGINHLHSFLATEITAFEFFYQSWTCNAVILQRLQEYQVFSPTMSLSEKSDDSQLSIEEILINLATSLSIPPASEPIGFNVDQSFSAPISPRAIEFNLVLKFHIEEILHTLRLPEIIALKNSLKEKTPTLIQQYIKDKFNHSVEQNFLGYQLLFLQDAINVYEQKLLQFSFILTQQFNVINPASSIQPFSSTATVLHADMSIRNAIREAMGTNVSPEIEEAVIEPMQRVQQANAPSTSETTHNDAKVYAPRW